MMKGDSMVCDSVYVCVKDMECVLLCVSGFPWVPASVPVSADKAPLHTNTHTHTFRLHSLLFSLRTRHSHFRYRHQNWHITAWDCSVNYYTIGQDWIEVQKHGEGIKCSCVHSLLFCKVLLTLALWFWLIINPINRTLRSKTAASVASLHLNLKIEHSEGLPHPHQ